MKYLLVLAVLAVAIGIWRSRRDTGPTHASPHAPRAPATPLPMVACRHCDTRLPEVDALRGQLGFYCSVEHLRLCEPGH